MPGQEFEGREEGGEGSQTPATDEELARANYPDTTESEKSVIPTEEPPKPAKKESILPTEEDKYYDQWGPKTKRFIKKEIPSAFADYQQTVIECRGSTGAHNAIWRLHDQISEYAEEHRRDRKALAYLVAITTRQTLENINNQRYGEGGIIRDLGPTAEFEKKLIMSSAVSHLCELEDFDRAMDWAKNSRDESNIEKVNREYAKYRKTGGKKEKRLETDQREIFDRFMHDFDRDLWKQIDNGTYLPDNKLDGIVKKIREQGRLCRIPRGQINKAIEQMGKSMLSMMDSMNSAKERSIHKLEGYTDDEFKRVKNKFTMKKK